MGKHTESGSPVGGALRTSRSRRTDLAAGGDTGGDFPASTAAYIDSQQVQQKLAPLLKGSHFFDLDLNAVRQELESLPLIAKANVRKRWPAELIAELTPHQPLSRWGEQGLLAENGQLLPSGAEQFAHLPQLIGPVGSEQALYATYQQFESMLSPLGLSLSKLEQSESGRVFLSVVRKNSGSVIEFALGSGDWSGKMQRFIRFAKQSATDLSQLTRVDLRHRNGFALALTGQAKQEIAR